jgi:hypothetical protein
VVPRPPPVAHAGLVTYSFAAIDHPNREPLEQFVGSIWDSLATLGMDAPIEALELPLNLNWPEVSTDDRIRLLAARERRKSGDEVYQAFSFATHDTIALVSNLAPNRAATDTGLETWGELYREWSAAVPGRPPLGFLGQVLVFSALSNADAGDIPALLEDGVRRSLPATDGHLPFYRTDQDLFVWSGSARGSMRSIAVLAPMSQESSLDRWIWWTAATGSDGVHQGLAHCLLHAAKLRYEQAAYGQRVSDLSEARGQVQRALDSLLDVQAEAARAPRAPRLGPPLEPGLYTTEELVEGQQRLSLAQAAAGGLLFASTKLEELKQSIEIAARNIATLMPRPHPAWKGPAGGPLFAADLLRAENLGRQISYDVAYADALRQRASEAHNVTSLRLHQASERQRSELSRLMLLQSALVAALGTAWGVAGLAADQPDEVKAPLIAVVVGAVLALSHLIPHLADRYNAVDYVLAGLFGGSVLWLGATLLARWWDVPVAALAVPGIVVGAALGPLLARSFHRRLQARRL